MSIPDVPETIYSPKSIAVELAERLFVDDITYHRAKTCVWETEDDDWNVWDTGCANAFEFTYDGPKENFFVWCPYCGGRIEIEETNTDE